MRPLARISSRDCAECSRALRRLRRLARRARPALQQVPGMRFSAAAHVLERAVAQKSFPAAVIECGDATGPLWRQAFGRLHLEADAPAAVDDTIFDLASLTKVLATTTLVMQQVERGAIGLDDRVGRHVAAWQDAGRVQVTIRDLLGHCAGLAAHVPFLPRLPAGGRPAARCVSSSWIARRRTPDRRGVASRVRAGGLSCTARLHPACEVGVQRPRVHPAGTHPRRGRQPSRTF